MTASHDKYAPYYARAAVILYAYKQEDFIEEAVSAILAQDCPAIDIVLSDDCSPDRTFDIMSRLVDNYTGHHRPKAVRNPKNMGLMPHVNARIQEAQADLIIPCGGDDRFAPDTVRRYVEFWADNGEPAMISNNPVKMAHDGAVIGKHHASVPERVTAEGILGLEPAQRFVGAYSKRKIIVPFGPLREDYNIEDEQFHFRAALADRILNLEGDLYYYRQHDNSLSVWSKMRGQSDDEWLKTHIAGVRESVGLGETWVELCRKALAQGLIDADRYKTISGLAAARLYNNLSLHRALSGEMTYFQLVRALISRKLRLRNKRTLLLAFFSKPKYVSTYRARLTRAA